MPRASGSSGNRTKNERTVVRISSGADQSNRTDRPGWRPKRGRRTNSVLCEEASDDDQALP